MTSCMNCTKRIWGSYRCKDLQDQERTASAIFSKARRCTYFIKGEIEQLEECVK